MNVSNIIRQMLSESSCHGHLLYNINTATKYRYFCYVAIMMYDIIVCYITNYCVQVIQHIPLATIQMVVTLRVPRPNVGNLSNHSGTLFRRLRV